MTGSAALQGFVDGILQRRISDGANLSARHRLDWAATRFAANAAPGSFSVGAALAANPPHLMLIHAPSDVMPPLELGWKARAQAELELRGDAAPYLVKRAGGRDISGLSAYEQ